MSKTKSGAIQFKGEKELPFMPASQGTMAFNPTGTWKYIEPYYQDKTPPCNADCPTDQDIVIQLALCAEGRFDEALEIMRMANPFPAVTGRVCPHPCESRCNRKDLGGVVSIRLVERFLGDYAIRKEIRYTAAAKTGKRIAVVGSGPAGLSCAFYLARKGHSVVVHESLDVIGGLLATGIPEFRLPRSILEAELKIFEGLPVEFKTNSRLGANLSVGDLKKYDAAYIAVGKYKSERLSIPGEETPGVTSGIEILRMIRAGSKLPLGKRAVVVGGGNTALDCARSLMRLGHDVRVLYRRSEKEMPAFPDDIEESLEEGTKFEFLTAPVRVISKHGKVNAVECVRMKLGDADQSGRRVPLPVKGSELIIETDSIVTAIGEKVNDGEISGLKNISDKGITVRDDCMTEIPGIFAGGDCVAGGGTVSSAIGRGRRAAEAIDANLSNRQYRAETLTTTRGAANEIVDFSKLNTAYVAPAPAPEKKRLPPEKRRRGFEEINRGLTLDEAVAEAKRCIGCGTCTYCDNCRVFCPDVAIAFRKEMDGYDIDYGHCKGCGICMQECPRSAMKMRNVRGGVV